MKSLLNLALAVSLLSATAQEVDVFQKSDERAQTQSVNSIASTEKSEHSKHGKSSVENSRLKMITKAPTSSNEKTSTTVYNISKAASESDKKEEPSYVSRKESTPAKHIKGLTLSGDERYKFKSKRGMESTSSAKMPTSHAPATSKQGMAAGSLNSLSVVRDTESMVQKYYFKTGPRVKALLQFPEAPSFAFKDSVPSEDYQGIIDELEKAFPDLFQLSNSTCTVEFYNIGNSFYYPSERVKSPIDSVTETYTRSMHLDYDFFRKDNEPYRVKATCVDDDGNDFPIGTDFFEKFGEVFKIPAIFDSSMSATLDSHPSEMSFETKSTFNSSDLGPPNFHVEDQIVFTIKMHPNYRNVRPLGDRKYSPAWLPYVGSINLALQDYEATSRDKQNPGFNIFPLGRDLAGQSNGFSLEWSVRLFNHDLLNKLENSTMIQLGSTPLMTYKLKGEDITFEAAIPLATSTPSQQPSSVRSENPSTDNPTHAVTYYKTFTPSQQPTSEITAGPKFQECHVGTGPNKAEVSFIFPEAPSFAFKDSVPLEEHQGIIDELEKAFPDLFQLSNSYCFVSFENICDYECSFTQSSIVESPIDSNTETYTRSTYDFYSENNQPYYTVKADCLDEYYSDFPIGTNFFEKFGVPSKVAAIVDSSMSATIEAFPHQVSFETKSTFNSSDLGPPNLHLEDQISFAVEMNYSQRGERPLDDWKYSPAWLPNAGSINFALKVYEETSRDEQNPGFNAFPFGKDLGGYNNDFSMVWSVRLFNHDLLNKLEGLPLMTFKLKGAKIRFKAAVPYAVQHDPFTPWLSCVGKRSQPSPVGGESSNPSTLQPTMIPAPSDISSDVPSDQTSLFPSFSKPPRPPPTSAPTKEIWDYWPVNPSRPPTTPVPKPAATSTPLQQPSSFTKKLSTDHPSLIARQAEVEPSISPMETKLITDSPSDGTLPPPKPSKSEHNIFSHEHFEDLCQQSKSYRFKLDNGNMRKCSYITKKDTKARQDMYCKDETAKECCKACKIKKCDDKSKFKFKLKNGKSADCSWFKKGKGSRRKSKYCKGKVKRKCCESCS